MMVGEQRPRCGSDGEPDVHQGFEGTGKRFAHEDGDWYEVHRCQCGARSYDVNITKVWWER